MEITLKDFYGQHIQIHNNTRSGNVRFEVRTTANLNDAVNLKKEDCPIITDISLDYAKTKLIHQFLSAVLEEVENED